jgi:hypothetical protein
LPSWVQKGKVLLKKEAKKMCGSGEVFGLWVLRGWRVLLLNVGVVVVAR